MELLKNPADIERLVQQFYRPGKPQGIKEIDEHLQALQLSDQGWQLADMLLQSEDRNVRFFGALTFTIKIKRDWATLNEQASASLLNRLLQNLTHLVNCGESTMVVKKLCNALIAYYLLPSTCWETPVTDIMVALAGGQGLVFDGSSSVEVARILGYHQLLAALWFATGLAEEAKQALAVNTQNQKYQERIASNIHDVASLLHISMNIPIQQDCMIAKHVQEGMKCFQSWIMYAQRAWIDRLSDLSPLQTLTPLVIEALDHDELYEESADILSDVLSNFSTFLTGSDYDALATLLSRETIQTMITDLTNGDQSPEGAVFARLCLAYGEACVQDLARCNDPNLIQIMNQLMQLLNHTGYPGVEDDLYCSQALAFWQTYAEFITDSLFTLEPDQEPSWMPVARVQVLKVLEICWAKIQYPPSEVASSWDSDDRSSFQAFRGEVQDILRTSYTLLGIEIFEKSAWLASKSMNETAWLPLEASLFYLNALSEAVSDEIRIDNILSQLFGSSLFSEMTKWKDGIPAKTRQIAVTMITKFIGFFERHFEYLPATLNFLFDLVRVPELANVAAKAISTACSSCRHTLIPDLCAFITRYEDLQYQDDVDVNTKEKVIGGITAIIQALPSEESKLVSLGMLVGFIESDARKCLNAMHMTRSSNEEPADSQAYGIAALKCLASIGKALQTPDDIAIDLDAETPNSPFWTAGDGVGLQEKVIAIVESITSMMPSNSDVMEASCHIFRSGYKETRPGLFVFPPQIIVRFLLSASLHTSRLDLVINTTSSMLCSQSYSSAAMPEAVSMCLDYTIKLLTSLNHNPSTEPEVAASIIDLANRCVPHYLPSMCFVQEIDKIFNFALYSLASPEIMPNRSAADFWASFVQKYDLTSEPASAFQAQALQKYGPVLCQILIHSIAGEVPRSSLDTLAGPLKKLVFARPQAKQWLSAALDHPNFPSQKVDATQKRLWLQKVMSLRGSRKTNNEVKDFWIACRGPASNFAF